MPIRVGAKVVCPSCERVLLEVIEDLYFGEQILAHKFKQVEHKHHGAGSPMWCEFCRTPWFREGAIHTEKGWTRG